MITTKDQNPEQSTHQKRHRMRFALWAIVIAVIVGAAFWASTTQKELFKAELTQTGNLTTHTFPLYIPDDYKAQAGDSVELEVIVGNAPDGLDTAQKILGITSKFSFNPNEITFTTGQIFEWNGTEFAGVSLFVALEESVGGELNLSFLDPSGVGVTLDPGDVAFKLKGVLNSDNLNPEDIVTINNIELTVEGETTPLSLTTSDFGDGQITIAKRACSTSEEPNPDWDCGLWGACDASGFENRICNLVGDCDPGASNENRPPTQRACTCEEWVCTDWGPCTDGTQSRTCPEADALPDGCVVRASTPAMPPVTQECGLLIGDVIGIILSLDEPTVNNLTPEQHTEAFAAALILINSSDADGGTIDVEGTSVPLQITGSPPTEKEKLENIASNLATSINAAGVDLSATPNTQLPGSNVEIPGLVLVYPTGNNEEVDIDPASQAGNVTIAPFPVNGLTINKTDSYGLQIIGKFEDGSTSLLVPRQMDEWVNDTNNRLSDIDLDAGRLKASEDTSGFSTIYATVIIEDPDTGDQFTIFSNTVTVNVPSGPVIGYARIEGAGDIAQGSRVDLSVKVSDYHTIEDIQDIRTLIQETDTNTIFDIAPFSPSELQDINSGAEDGEEADPQDPDESLNYRIYDIPVDVPLDANLVDGNYDLVIEITDAAGYVAAKAIPIYIGTAVWGDVNGDGFFNMGDVIRAFQISGNPGGATAREKAAADVVQNGIVNLADVKTLFDALQQ